ncbi:MAG: glutamine-hydrolyzing GMP synthase [Candidatus Cloacimonetes bacterium]|nr:glutamine-hydrolyzing GMP synthase [Candidatus Cloacimonadota bacterium]
MQHQQCLIIDFGSQYTQLIAKTVRRLNIFSEIVPCTITWEEFQQRNPRAVILSGSPWSITRPDAPVLDPRILAAEMPMLGICYGMQLLVQAGGGKVIAAKKKEYGRARIHIEDRDSIFRGLDSEEEVWMSHGDAVQTLPEGFRRIARSDNSPFAAIMHESRPVWALQFHPEVANTPHGAIMIENFCDIAGFSLDWTPTSFIESTVADIRAQVGEDRVILGLSGGVDSSVVAALLHKAVGEQLVPILVDTGLLRQDEAGQVREAFQQAFGMELIVIDAASTFFERLAGVADPEYKRKIIGKTFIEIFEAEAARYPDARFLAQGTLYPDIIESVSFKGPSATIKSHHNVGGLPEQMNLELVEPLRELFKDEVREVGRKLGLPGLLVNRHPFPGPGLAIRIISDVTREKAELLQRIDVIFIDELHEAGLYDSTWQAFAVLLPIQSVGVMGDERTYENVCALRAVCSTDGMTADWTEFPHWFLKRVSNRIINEVRGVNRVVYDISSKPPATIEWE